jgi:hypothetical protein
MIDTLAAQRRAYVIGLDAAGDAGLDETQFHQLVEDTGYQLGWPGTLSGPGRHGLTHRRGGRYYRTPITTIWAGINRGEDEYGWAGADLAEFYEHVGRYAGIDGVLWRKR